MEMRRQWDQSIVVGCPSALGRITLVAEGLLQGNQSSLPIVSVSEGTSIAIVLDKSPFYYEALRSSY
jgi:hypothetical protein